jgi:hypothetical protein
MSTTSDNSRRYNKDNRKQKQKKQDNHCKNIIRPDVATTPIIYISKMLLLTGAYNKK